MVMTILRRLAVGGSMPCFLLAVSLATAQAAAPTGLKEPTAGPVQRIDDYAAASDAARQANAMLLVSVEPRTADPADVAGSHLDRPEALRRLAASGTPWVVCRVGMPDGGAELVAQPSLAEMRRGPGVFVVDYAHDEWRGLVVSILPRAPGKYYRFEPSHIDEVVGLPPASLAQRSMILAVRLHPERPQSTLGACDPALCAEAAAHSAHQARIRRQGHHGWETRAPRIAAQAGGGSAQEVCAESWENQDLLDSCVDCVASWRQSPGHWNAVRGLQSAYGYDIRRGSNGIWYATGIFLR
jgi:hypothetical protein